jgi:chorismate mutase
LFAALGVGIAVVGIGAGALLADGGGSDQSGDNKTVAASAPATAGSASASADAAEQQAIALDKLLADSGSSRASVISAVADVKACNNLAQAASDLRDAAKQRNELVTKLSGLTVDQLPNHAALTTALTKAWQASASADNHYAAWADQVAGSKKQSCKKGTARTTAQTQAGNRASGTASTQKAQAAKLWNEIAKTYGLTQRQPTQL